jgi:hypothetical protein
LEYFGLLFRVFSRVSRALPSFAERRTGTTARETRERTRNLPCEFREWPFHGILPSSFSRLFACFAGPSVLRRTPNGNYRPRITRTNAKFVVRIPRVAFSWNISVFLSRLFACFAGPSVLRRTPNGNYRPRNTRTDAKFAVRIPRVNLRLRHSIVARLLASQRNERAHPMVAQVKPSPDQYPGDDWDEK